MADGGAIRFLKGSEPAGAVFVGGEPRQVRVGKQRWAVEAILDHWRLDDEWWTEAPVERLYWEVVLTNGRKLIFWAALDAPAQSAEVIIYPSQG